MSFPAPGERPHCGNISSNCCAQLLRAHINLGCAPALGVAQIFIQAQPAAIADRLVFLLPIAFIQKSEVAQITVVCCQRQISQLMHMARNSYCARFSTPSAIICTQALAKFCPLAGNTAQ
ncbi:MAG: hypothetical protein IKH84_02390 [Ottowia sp.]|nr:hypothetical protein [Ottowia sp.]